MSKDLEAYNEIISIRDNYLMWSPERAQRCYLLLLIAMKHNKSIQVSNETLERIEALTTLNHRLNPESIIKRFPKGVDEIIEILKPFYYLE